MKKTVQGAADGGDYDPVDEEFVDNANKMGDGIGDKIHEFGRIIDEYVCAKGGVKYGTALIERIALHPRLRWCSSRTLRRYWAYFRFLNEFGADFTAKNPSLTPSHVYELSRLMGSGSAKNDAATGLDPCNEQVNGCVKWMAERAAGAMGRVTSDELRSYVTGLMKDEVLHLLKADSATQARRPAETYAARKKRASITELIAFGPEGLGRAADYIVTFAEPEHLEKGKFKVPQLVQDVNRLSHAMVAIMDHLADLGEGDAILSIISTLCQELVTLEEEISPHTTDEVA